MFRHSIEEGGGGEFSGLHPPPPHLGQSLGAIQRGGQHPAAWPSCAVGLLFCGKLYTQVWPAWGIDGSYLSPSLHIFTTIHTRLLRDHPKLISCLPLSRLVPNTLLNRRGPIEPPPPPRPKRKRIRKADDSSSLICGAPLNNFDPFDA